VENRGSNGNCGRPVKGIGGEIRTRRAWSGRKEMEKKEKISIPKLINARRHLKPETTCIGVWQIGNPPSKCTPSYRLLKS